MSEASARATPQQVLVLIAEDDAPIADVIAFIVEEARCTPVLARHGKEALALAERHWPALVITDLMMPLLDGAGLIAALRAAAARRNTPPPPVILLTAAGALRAEGLDADAVLHKPFDLGALDALVRRFLPGAMAPRRPHAASGAGMSAHGDPA